MRALAVALLLPLLVGTAEAQSLVEIEKAESAVIAVWEMTPLTFRRALFVTEANGFGVYRERPAGPFTGGEPLLVYAEPVGYSFKDNEDGTYAFGFDVDLIVKTSTGKIVAGQDNFQKLMLVSRAKNREFMLTLTLDLQDAPPGDYIVEYRTKDAFGPKVATISLPFSIAAK